MADESTEEDAEDDCRLGSVDCGGVAGVGKKDVKCNDVDKDMPPLLDAGVKLLRLFWFSWFSEGEPSEEMCAVEWWSPGKWWWC